MPKKSPVDKGAPNDATRAVVAAARATDRQKLEPGKPPPIEPSTRELTWIAISLSPFERAVIDELFRRGGFARLDDVVMAGLWHLARQLDVPITTFSKGRV